jgi:hypothetical protein
MRDIKTFGTAKTVRRTGCLLVCLLVVWIASVAPAGYDANEPNLFVPLEAVRCVRNSRAYPWDLNAGAAPYDVNVPRLETVCSVTLPEVTWSAVPGYYAQGVDGQTILCAKRNSTKLDKTTTTAFQSADGYETVIDINTSDQTAGVFQEGMQVFSACVLPNGRWLLCFGLQSDGGYLFYSDDKGLTWTRCGVSGGTYSDRLDSGYVAGNWQFQTEMCPEMVIGEYGYKDKADGNLNPRHVYYSNDCGANWHMIYKPPAQVGMHTHKVTFAPNTTDVVYVSYGDSPYSKLVKLSYAGGDKTDANNWTASTVKTSIQPTAVYSDGQYLYLGRDGSGDKGPLIMRLDPTDDSFKSVFAPPAAYNYPGYSPFGMGLSFGNIFRITRFNGVFYAAVEGQRAEEQGNPPDMYRHGGIYVSQNGSDWVCVYRLIYDGTISNPPSVVDLVGYSDGYIWGHAINTDGNTYIVRIEPVDAKDSVGVLVESPAVNVLNADQSNDFSGVNGNFKTWRMDQTDTGVLSQDTSDGLADSNCLKFTGRSGMSLNAMLTSPSPQSDKISTGQRTCASFWVKAADGWPDDFLCWAQFREGNIVEAASFFKPISQWQKVMVWGTAIANNKAPDLRITIDRHRVPADQWQAAIDGKVLYIDAVQITNFTHNANQSWQVGGSPRAKEYCISDIQGITGDCTVALEWHPRMSSYELKASDPDIGIASFSDGTDYVDLYYDCSAGTFVAEDGTNRAVGDPVAWLHDDSIEFVVGLGGAICLSYQTPTTSEVDNSVPQGSWGDLSTIKYGTNNDLSLGGAGVICNVRVWNYRQCATGPCCHYDLTCEIKPEFDCNAGVWLGPYSDCQECGSIITGACCRPDNKCELTAASSCLDGYWMGADGCDDPKECYWVPTIVTSPDTGFDIDGYDTVSIPVMDDIPNDKPLSEPLSQFAYLPNNTVFMAKFLLVSLAGDSNEIIGVTLDTSKQAPYPVTVMYPVADIDANNVSSLDVLGQPDAEGFRLFSVSHSAAGGLDPGSIYMADNNGPPVLIIRQDIHLGLVDNPETDVDEDADISDFELVWLEQQPGSGGQLALIFSVHSDDPMTADIDESGGLNPNMIYASFMTGTHFPLLEQPLDGAVNGLSNWYRSLKQCNFPLADVDGDGFVDFYDYVDLANCYAGPDRPWSQKGIFDRCLCLDRNDDGSVDLSDLAYFVELWLHSYTP